MTPTDFIRKWKAAELKERSAAQEHFLDLCQLLGERTPAEADPTGEWYCFEKGASKLTGGEGWADVWKRGCFGWEYKGKRKDLKAAYVQLQQYAVALENPPLLIVCDLTQFRIHTNWTNTVQHVYEIALDDLHDANKRQWLKQAFADPDALKPGQTRQALTEAAAERFAGLAQELRHQGHAPHTVAHFINRLIFCMFAEDIGLLPNQLFTRLLEHALTQPTEFAEMARDLFRAMKGGGRVGFERVEWFNGGLFDNEEVLPLTRSALEMALKAARLDWSDIDPSIFGTLFERGLDPSKRSQLGAHYTDRDKIMLLVEPVIVQPLRAEWDALKLRIAGQMEKVRTAKNPTSATKAREGAQDLHNHFLERLRQVRILDPACGSGNFLYLALRALKDVEHQVNLDAETLGLERQFPSVGPECVKGIEINPYAAELARVTVWIGEIQWMRRNGFDVARQPILRPLETIECRDALLNADGTEAAWPKAEFIVGNPPFLGGSKLLRELGEDYTRTLRRIYQGRVPGGADLVCYWFNKALAGAKARTTEYVGLVATQSIRKGVSRSVLEQILEENKIFKAWSDEPWVNEGAAVRVSLICFGKTNSEINLDGQIVETINADLSAGQNDVTKARRLVENLRVAFKGTEKGGAFEILGKIARQWLVLPNPSGCSNRDVLRPWINGSDITGRLSDTWVIDFDIGVTQSAASLYEAPFEYLLHFVKPARMSNRELRTSKVWWLHRRRSEDLRQALAGIPRYIATPRVAKYRVFIWLNSTVLPDSRLYVIARSDNVTFGILQSHIHELWALANASWHGVGNDPTYNAASCFETFPFPTSLTPNIPAVDYESDPRAQAIAQAAQRLNELRENWLNPPQWIKRVPEIVSGYPDRLLPVDDNAAAELKKRTLTNLYNQRPMWLANAHKDLDTAVAAAYGWPDDLSDDEVLQRLLALNLERARQIKKE